MIGRHDGAQERTSLLAVVAVAAVVVEWALRILVGDFSNALMLQVQLMLMPLPRRVMAMGEVAAVERSDASVCSLVSDG